MYGVWSIRAATVLATAALLVSAAMGQRSQEITRDMENRPMLGPVSVEYGGLQSFQGSSAPGAIVQVRVEGRLMGSTLADAVGAWRLTLPVPLEAGAHTVQVVARSGSDGVQRQGEVTRINIPATGLRRLSTSEDVAVERAGTFADEATRVFDQLMPVLEPKDGAIQVVQATGRTGDAWRAAAPAGERELIDVASDWFDRAARQYSDVIVRRLAGDPVPLTAGRSIVVAEAPQAAPRRAQVGGGAEPDLFQGVINSIRRWFDRANSDYQRVIVRQLSEPAPGGAAVVKAPTPTRSGTDGARAPRPVVTAVPEAPVARAPERPSAPPAVVAQKAGEPEGLDWLQDRVGRWFGRANKDYQDVIVKQLSEPTGGRAGEVALVPPRATDRVGVVPVPPSPPAAKVDEGALKAAEAARLAEQARVRAAELNADEERRRVAAETAQRAENQRRAEEQERLRLAEEARRSSAADQAARAEAQRREEQERQRVAQADAAARLEAQRREEQERQRAAEEARRVAAADAAKAAAMRRAEEDERRRAAAAQRAAEEAERRRVAAAQRQQASERAVAEAARRAEEQRARRAAAAPVETTRTPAGRSVEKATASRVAAAPSRRVSSAQRRAYAKSSARTRSVRRSTQALARVQRARSGPAIARVARPAKKAKARARDRRYCLPRRTAAIVVPQVVVVELRGGVYHSVFEREYDRQRIVMPSQVQVAELRGNCTTVAVQ